MNKKVYVCTGTCGAEISEEQFRGGLTQCGTQGCSMHSHQFEERLKCGVCEAVYKANESHSHS